MAARAGRFRRQARRRDRHRRHRRADHPDHRGTSRSSHRVPAHAELVRAAAQRQDRRRDAEADQGRLSRDVRALPGDLCLLPAHAGSARRVRGVRRGARGVLRKALRRARLRHLAGQFPRHPDRPQGQCDHQRFRRAKDPRAREGPEGGGKTDSRGITALAPAGCRSRRFITRSTTATMSSWSTSRKRRSSGSRRRASRPARANTNSTSSSSPPASTPSPAASTRSISAAPTARG